jgi:hypothetical protein
MIMFGNELIFFVHFQARETIVTCENCRALGKSEDNIYVVYLRSAYCRYENHFFTAR